MVTIFISLLLLSSPLNAHDLTFTTMQDGVTLSARIMQPHESRECLLHNLFAYQLYPIKLIVTNSTHKTWLISGNSIEELSLVPPHLITKDIIFQHNTIATLTAYGCAVAGWLGIIAGFSVVQEYLPNLAQTTKYISAAATLCSFIYQAHQIATHRSNLYRLTEQHIIEYGLSGTNIMVEPGDTITRIMFLNNKSPLKTMSPEDNFYYLFTVKLYNLYKSSDTIIIPVEVPKLYLPSL
jgi:hypothetical protein